MEIDSQETTKGDATPEDQLNMELGRPVLEKDKFDCPVCRTTQYHEIHITGRNGRDFKLPLYACYGCTTVFMDAWRFKRVVRRDYDERGFPNDVVTRGPDDRPWPIWRRALSPDADPPGGWSGGLGKIRSTK